MPNNNNRPDALRPEVPLCCNIVRLQDYRLPPDELIFFEWLLVKQTYVFHFRPFHYSQQRIERETRIARRRLATIVDKFIDNEWIDSEVRPKNDERGLVRYYCVNFDCIIDDLDKILIPGTDTFAAFIPYLRDLDRRARKVEEDGMDPETLRAFEEVAPTVRAMQEIYRQRVRMYNAGDLTGEVPRRVKLYAQIPFRHAHKILLHKLLTVIDRDSVERAFTAYADGVLCGTYDPKSLMGLFLTRETDTGDFSVVHECLDHYIAHYGKDI